jgi:hypothetical protein
LVFNADGLSVYESGLQILNNKKEVVFKGDQFGNLYIKGSGVFQGEITATSGSFKGELNAGRGYLGQLNVLGNLRITDINNDNVHIDIGQYFYKQVTFALTKAEAVDGKHYFYNPLTSSYELCTEENYKENEDYYIREEVGGIKSSNFNSDGSKGFLITPDGKIIANELVIGNSASIANVLQVGSNCKILNPDVYGNGGKFITITKTENGTVENILSLNNEG